MGCPAVVSTVSTANSILDSFLSSVRRDCSLVSASESITLALSVTKPVGRGRELSIPLLLLPSPAWDCVTGALLTLATEREEYEQLRANESNSPNSAMKCRDVNFTI